MTGELDYSDDRVGVLKISSDNGWSSNLIEALNRIEEDYVIYFQEDYFLQSHVDSKKVEYFLDILKKEKAICMRLKGRGPNLKYKNYTDVGEIGVGEPYRAATQATIWNKSVLLNLLKEGESGWDFELRGGKDRADKILHGFLSVKELVIPYTFTAIEKGKYIYEAVRQCRESGVEIDKNSRPVESFVQYL